MKKYILQIFDLKSLNFKHRKFVHFALLTCIVFLQLILLIILYNEIFNESKLATLEADLKVSEKAKALSDTTKKDYIAVQYNLQNYIDTKNSKYLESYNIALTYLNQNIDSLVKTANNNKSFLLYLKNEKTDGTSISKLNKRIDSLVNIQILPSPYLQKDLLDLKQFDYKDILNSVNVESNIVVDSVKKKSLFSRLGKAISGNVDVQKEKLNVIVTMKYGNKITTGNIEEQLANAFDRTNKHYQNEFSRYKNNLSSLKGKDSDFISRNNKILNYSDLLLKKYDKVLNSFTNDSKIKFQEQYQTNKTIRNYTIIGLVLFMFVISWVLILLTRLAFDYEKRLLFAQDKIQQNLNFKNRIVGMISHEIRSPLNIISIYSRIISKQIQDESLKESFKNIDFTTNSLLLLTNQILEYSKNENVKLKLNEKDFNLNTELSEIFKGLTTLVKSNGNNLIIESNLKKDVVVHSDAVKIQQLFYNIVGNSNKFTKKGFINILINTEKTTDNRINLLVEISDNGIGIDNNDLKNIFENYYQGVVSEDMQNLGAGLGLNLCKELIELFDGKINVTSKKNEGTSVFFNILLENSIT